MTMPETSTLISTHVAGARLIVKLHPVCVDFTNHESLTKELASSVSEATEVAIDLSGVRYVDSLGFEGLLSAVKNCPGRVRFVNASRSIISLFTLAHLDSLIEKP